MAIATHPTDFIVRNDRDLADARRNRRKSGRPASPADVRECEVYKVIDHVFGASLPDDDYGREVLRVLLNQMVLRRASIEEMRDRALDLLPELDDDDSLDNMIKEIGKGRRRSADQVARDLGVTYQMRTFLDLRTIGCCDMTKKQRDAIQSQKEAADKRRAREHAGARPQAQSNERTRPWEAMGICRATFYRRKKAAEKSACDCFGDHALPSFLTDKSVSSAENKSAPCGRLAAALRSAGERLVPDDHPNCSKVRPLADRPQGDPARARQNSFLRSSGTGRRRSRSAGGLWR